MNVEIWQQIKEIFSTAVDMPESERAAYIEEKCGHDDKLLAEVRSLLEAEKASDGFVEPPTIAVKFLTTDARQTALSGMQVGAFRILREIGRGGMGAVYLAERADGEFEQKVAIKLIKRGLDTDEIVRRFRYERQILANLHHPNITKLIDGGTTDDGLPYLVMDHVDGLPLNKFADETSLSLVQRLELFLSVCDAVSYAHQNLIIHRDLKPSNILVTKDGVPKLLDFGIAKLLQPDLVPMTRPTIADLSIMTPEYASPEQVRGEAVTTATDVYSLGIALYELLTGTRPYSFENQSLEKILHTVCESVPKAPSTALNFRLQTPAAGQTNSELKRSPGQVDPRSLNGDLDNIVLMALRKEPSRRYSSVEQFADDIRRYLKGLPVIAQDDTFTYRAGKFIRRNKAGVAAGAGIILSLVGGLAATAYQSKKTRRQRDKAEKVNEFLQEILASADPRRQGKDVKGILKLAARKIAKDFAGEPEIVSELETTVGLTFLNLGQIDLAEPLLRGALETRLRIFGRENKATAVSIYNFGRLAQAKGQTETAENHYREALSLLSRLRGSNQIEIASVLHDLAYTVSIQNRNEEAIGILQSELRIQRSLHGNNHPTVALALSEIGSSLEMIGDPAAAEPLQRQALKIIRQYYGDDHPDVAMILNNLIRTVGFRSPSEGEPLAHQALAIQRKFLDDDHPEICWTLYCLSFIAIAKGDFVNAERYARDVLLRRGKTLTDEHMLVASELSVLGVSLMANGKLAEAEAALRECIDLRRRSLTADHWLVATATSLLGECLARQDELEDGRRLLWEGYEVLLRELGAGHDQTVAAAERLKRFG